MTEYERVRQEIAEQLCNNDNWDWEQLDEKPVRFMQRSKAGYYKRADEILSLDSICIKSDDQSLPVLPKYIRWEDKEAARDYSQVMLNEGWVKCLKEE